MFCFSEDLRLCSLKSLFPVLSHGKGKSSLERRGGKFGKSVFFPDEIRRDLMSRFYHPNELKSSSGGGGGGGSGADIAINPALNFLP